MTEYKEYVRGYLKDYKESTADSDREQALWQQVMDNCTFAELPQDKVDEEVENMYNSYEQCAGYYGLEMADFLEQMGMRRGGFPYRAHFLCRESGEEKSGVQCHRGEGRPDRQ